MAWNTFAFVMVAAFGTWIPLAQLLPGVPQRSRTFYVTVGNVVFAGIALLAGEPARPGLRALTTQVGAGIVIAGAGGCVIGAMR